MELTQSEKTNILRMFDSGLVRIVVHCEPRDRSQRRRDETLSIMAELGYGDHLSGMGYFAVVGVITDPEPSIFGGEISPGLHAMGPRFHQDKIYFTNTSQFTEVGKTFDGTKHLQQHLKEVGYISPRPEPGFNVVSLRDTTP